MTYRELAKIMSGAGYENVVKAEILLEIQTFCDLTDDEEDLLVADCYEYWENDRRDTPFSAIDIGMHSASLISDWYGVIPDDHREQIFKHLDSIF